LTAPNNEVITINKAIQEFKENVDEWIKTINGRFDEFGELPIVLQEQTSNIEHNYELTKELQKENEALRKEIQTLKMTQLLIIKKVFNEDFKEAAKNKEFMKKVQSIKATAKSEA
jgi:hypothetical protein